MTILPSPYFEAYEIQGFRMLGAETPGQFIKPYAQRCNDHEAQFWTLYAHSADEGLQSLGDFASREEAEEILEAA